MTTRSVSPFASSLLVVFHSFVLLGAEPDVGTNSPGTVMLHNFLRQESVRLDNHFLKGITNKAQWEALRPKLHQEYLEMLGLWPLPERTPLQAKVTGTLEREEGFRVENVHFQSRPGLYVTGNLYLPKNIAPGTKLPAVLYVCGHSGRGRDGNKTAFQHHGMWFATHGYVCLMIDTLQLGEIAGIHHGTYRHNRWWWQARGYTSAGVECWNGIRALDYLQSRPEVDGQRLAVTGISGGGAATFWITAADERVKVAVPVSGMGDLEDYVGEKIVNGHCDCMFLINTFRWPWTHIAALVAPRPMLFENSGHDTIFPMNGNDRIRARLERLYGFYTNRTDRLFDIGVTPGGHEDNPELRLMAYRWINRHLKDDNSPVTEPDLPKIEGKTLRAFPEELPSDELNSKIDETFVPLATRPLPRSAAELSSLRQATLAELNRIAFRGVPDRIDSSGQITVSGSKTVSGTLPNEVPWKYVPGKGRRNGTVWLIVLNEDESFETPPEWIQRIITDAPAVLIAPVGTGPLRIHDPAPFYAQRSLALLGRTLDDLRLTDTLSAAHSLIANSERNMAIKIAGRGNAGVIAAYAALLEPGIAEVAAIEPPVSHREGPIFLNVLRVMDVPDAFGFLAPRPLTLSTSKGEAFARTAALYELAGGTLKRESNR